MSDITVMLQQKRYCMLWMHEFCIFKTTSVDFSFDKTEQKNGRSWGTQKCYMGDTGLLITHSFMDKEYIDNELYRDILLDRLHVNEGMLMENIVAQELRAYGHKLYFYSRADTNMRENNIEIDFLIRKESKICPVEVKSGTYRKYSSLDKFRKRFSCRIGQAYILYTKDILVKDDVVHLPLYFTMFLN